MMLLLKIIITAAVIMLLSARRAQATRLEIIKKTGRPLADETTGGTAYRGDSLEIDGDQLEESLGDWDYLARLQPAFHLTLRAQESLPANALCRSQILSIRANRATELGRGALCGCAGLKSASLAQVATIKEGALAHCANLEQISLPSLVKIGRYAFKDCRSLTGLFLPRTVSVGDQAFGGCVSLTGVTLPSAVTLGHNVFCDCFSLFSVSIPSAREVGERPFFGCTKLYTLELGGHPPAGFNTDTLAGAAYEDLTLLVPDISVYEAVAARLPRRIRTKEFSALPALN